MGRNMNFIKPKKLQTGDTISIIATSGNVDLEKIIQAKSNFENRGFKVKLGKHINFQNRYLAGTDEERLEDLHEAFLDNETNAIICARGGYGAIRLINDIDYELIKNNPKIFCGYSDITILNAMLLKKSNLITFSGPMVQSDFASCSDKYTIGNFFNTLSADKITITPMKEKIYKQGNLQGILWGGNLSTLTTLCGIDFIPDEAFIFFTEDLNEPTYKIDRYLRQLFLNNKFRKNIKAMILGDFLDLDNKNYFDEIICEIANELGISVISGYPISHSERKATIPYGAFAKLENNCITVENYLSI